MQYVVPCEGGPLHGKSIIWKSEYITYKGSVYSSVLHKVTKVPLRYCCERIYGDYVSQVHDEDLKESIDNITSSHPPLVLKVPLSIYELDTARRVKILTQLQNFVDSAITKYIIGQAEHGGKLEDRACFQEMHNEILDLMWYWYAEKERRDNQNAEMLEQAAKNILNR